MLPYLLSLQLEILAWAGFLVLAGCCACVLAIWKCITAMRELRAVNDRFAKIKALPATERKYGLSLEGWDRLKEAGTNLPAHSAGMWARIADSVECYTSPEGRDGYFVSRPLEELAPENPGLRQYYPADFLHSMPGVITSLGLLGTFLALLIGLMAVRPDPDNGGFTGINDLVSSLSGKFITSIVALLISVVVLMLDQHVCQPAIRRRYRALLTTIGNRLPYLTSARVLLDVQRLSVKQARSLSNISSEFIGAFKEAFTVELAPVLAKGLSASMASELQTEMIPTLVRIDSTMRDLTATVQRLEAEKQESVVGELRGLTESLETSLRTALGEMGAQFREALSSSTKDEFGQLANVVQGSAGVLQSMTTSFASMEATLRTIVEEARNSTTAQMSSSVEQTQRLNLLVEGLMGRLNDTANQNFEAVGAMLTTVVTRLSDKVTGLSEDLVRTVQNATQQTQHSADQTLKQAGSWTAQTSAQLQDLIGTLKAKSVDFERAGETLLAAQAALEQTLSQNQQALAALGQAAGHVRVYSEGLAGLQQRLNEGQQTHLSLATQSSAAVARLTEAAERQADLVAQYRDTIAEYQKVHSGLDSELERVLTTILVKMDTYTKGVEQSFEAVLATANRHFPDMAATLQDANDRLREQLDDLTEVLAAGTKQLRGT